MTTRCEIQCKVFSISLTG